MLAELLLSAYLSLANPSSADSLNSIPLQNTDALKINTENIVRYVSNKSEEEGVSDIRRHNEYSEYEEAWLYDMDKEEWIEMGLYASGWVDSIPPNSVEIDIQYIEHKIDSLENMSMFHNHPKKGHPQQIKYSFFPGLEKIIDMYNDIYAFTSSVIPSINDVRVMIHEESCFYKKHPDGAMKHKIVSHLGVTEYYLTEEAVDLINDDVVLIYGIDKDQAFLSSILDLSKVSFFGSGFMSVEAYCIDRIQEALSWRQSKYIDIKFIPF